MSTLKGLGGAGEIIHGGLRRGDREDGELGIGWGSRIEAIEEFPRGVPFFGPFRRAVPPFHRHGGGKGLEQALGEDVGERTFEVVGGDDGWVVRGVHVHEGFSRRGLVRWGLYEQMVNMGLRGDVSLPIPVTTFGCLM